MHTFFTNNNRNQGHIGNCAPTRDRGQSEMKWSRQNFEAGQVVKLGIRGQLRNDYRAQWVWLTLDG